MSTSYGDVFQAEGQSLLDQQFEELNIRGLTIIDSGLTEAELQQALSRVLELNAQLEAEYGLEYLNSINERNIIRSPLAYDDIFLNKVALNPALVAIVKASIGDIFQLHLQNAIVNTAQEVHHQRAWHRDLPYQNYQTSKPISISAMLCLTDFNFGNGGTEFVPYTHQLDLMPSANYVEKYSVTPEMKAGQIAVFNSFVFHRAGLNQSNAHRVGINNIFTTPIIKQQISLPEFLDGKYSDRDDARKLLAYDFPHITSDKQFKELRLNKFNASK